MDEMIGMFVNSLEGYQGCIVREVQEEAQREGLALEVYDAGHNAPKQAQDLVRFGNQHPGKRLCAFLIPEADAISDGGADPILRLATRVLQKGVGLLTLNHGREDLIASLRAQFPALPISLIAIDNVEFGRMQGRQLRMLMPEGGTALYIRGNPADSACRDRADGMKEELQHVSGIVVEEITARWDADLAEPYVHKWVTSPIRRQMELHAVVSQNDHMGEAARRALWRAADELGRPDLKKVPVLGGDGLADFGLRWVAEGSLTATVCVTLPGRPAVQQIAQYWRNGTPLPAVTKLPVTSHPDLAALRPARA
jgi:ABC-type sugar transport system substrate-binding protein